MFLHWVVSYHLCLCVLQMICVTLHGVNIFLMSPDLRTRGKWKSLRGGKKGLRCHSALVIHIFTVKKREKKNKRKYLPLVKDVSKFILTYFLSLCAPELSHHSLKNVPRNALLNSQCANKTRDCRASHIRMN